MKTSQIDTYKKNCTLKNHQKKLLLIISKIFKKKKYGKILDIGCANGSFLNFFKKKYINYELFGIDTSKIMIKIAKNLKISESKFFCKDFMTMNNKTKFDIVVSSGVLAFYDNFSKPINKMISLLKKDGHLFIFGTFNSENIDTLVKFRNNYNSSNWEKGLNSFSVNTISKFLKKKEIKFKFIKFNLPFSLKKKKNPILSYTFNINKKKKLILNGANIRLELYYLIIKKK